jgi:hypothetical protein
MEDFAKVNNLIISSAVCTTNPEPGAPGAPDPPPEAELG